MFESVQYFSIIAFEKGKKSMTIITVNLTTLNLCATWV